MRYFRSLRATVLVYTMVLVVIGVFMATVVLNIAVQLSIEYENRNIEISLSNTIKTKGDLSMKYANDVNNTGSGFVDILSCPTGITMSGTTVRTTGIDTQIRFLDNTIVCHVSSGHAGNDIDIFFNNDFTDIEFAQYGSFQIAVNSGNLSGSFPDSDSTLLTLANTGYFLPDGIDDNFDSDNYNVNSTSSVSYPDNYVDNDSDAKLLNYGYILEGAGLYNAFWSNSRMKQYIQSNSNNTDSIHQTLGVTDNGFLEVDIDSDHTLHLYEINTQSYDNTNELIIENIYSSEGQSGAVGYIQSDMSIASSTGSAFEFDFANNDYALFIENTGSGTILYQIRGEGVMTGKQIYINPLDDSDPSLFSYLGSHMFVDEEGRLIGDMFEVFGLKNNGGEYSNINLVEFTDGDFIENISLTGFDTTGYTIEINDFSTDLGGRIFAIGEGFNRYLRVEADGRIRLIARGDDDSVVLNVTTPIADALTANTKYDINFTITNSSYSLTIDGNIILSGAISGITNFNLLSDINYLPTTGTFRTSGITYRDGLGNIIFRETGDAASWNVQLTSGSVEDV